MTLLYSKEENLERLLSLIEDPEEKAILLTLYLHCVDANRFDDRLTNEDVDFCLRLYDKDKVFETIGKWFVEGAEKPLISVIDYVDA